MWKNNVKKTKRLAGKQYTSASGKTIRAKEVQPQDCSKCRFKCSVKISDDERKEIFQNYWNLQNYQRHRDLICNTIVESKPARIRTTARRSRKSSRTFVLKIKDNSNRICNFFYLKTLDIGEKKLLNML